MILTLATIDDITLGHRNLDFPELVEDLDTIPELVLHVQRVDHQRLVALDIFDGFLQWESC